MEQVNQKKKELIKSLFSTGSEIQQQKKECLEHLHQFFPELTQLNIQSFTLFFQQWISYEPDPTFTRKFTQKLRELVSYFFNNNKADLSKQLFKLYFNLICCDDEITRRNAISLCLQQMQTNQGSFFIKGFVKNLLTSEEPYKYESGLRIIGRFSQRFLEGNELILLLDKQYLCSNYLSRKITLAQISEMTLKNNINLKTTEIIYNFLNNQFYYQQHQQMIQVMLLKTKIIIFFRFFQLGSPCYNQLIALLKKYYTSPLIRIKYVLIELTPYLIKMYSQSDAKDHATYIYKNMSPEQVEIAELGIKNLKYVYQTCNENQRVEFINKFIQIVKDDHIIMVTIAECLIELLIDMPIQFVCQKITLFLQSVHAKKAKYNEQKEKQRKIRERQQVKSVVISSIRKHPHAHQLYIKLGQTIRQIFSNPNWQIRHRSIQLLEHFLQFMDINLQIIELFKNLIFDRAYRIRMNSIDFVKRYLHKPLVKTNLIPFVIEQSSHVNYKMRLMVLYFVQETYEKVENQIKIAFQNVVLKLRQDPIENVRDVANDIK